MTPVQCTVGKVGDLVYLVDNRRGVIRFVGAICGKEGIWYGVELESAPGKNNGQFQGVQYFTTSKPNSGVFVSPKDVSHGSDLMHEIYETYRPLDHSQAISIKNKEVSIHIDKNVQEVINDFYQLQVVSLCYSATSMISQQNTKKFERCTMLSLQNCLLTSWSNLIMILKYFPKIDNLDIYGNQMESIQTIAHKLDELKEFTTTIKSLNVGKCGVVNEDVKLILELFPSLDSFSLAKSNIDNLCLEGKVYPNINLLYLEQCEIHDFGVLKEGLLSLPNLKSLTMCSCCMSEVPADIATYLPKLELLNLKNNNFTSWKIINNLKKISTLLSLHVDISELPKGENLPDNFEILLAKCPHIPKLNNMFPTPTQRQKAEYTFLREVSPEEVDHREDRDRLVKIYGATETIKRNELDASKMKLGLLKIIVKEGEQWCQLNVPPTATLKILLTTACRMLKLQRNKIESVHLAFNTQDVDVTKDKFNHALNTHLYINGYDLENTLTIQILK
uniref:Tubulin-specific chaperone E n=1 Tax=Rhabditophanes sp. KR3021 TaxID=114890 RepID=A0AC35U0R0_9BILA